MNIPINILAPYPILPGIISVFIVIGLTWASYKIFCSCIKRKPELLELFCSAIIFLSLISSFIYITMHLGIMNLLAARLIGIILFSMGIIGVYYWIKEKKLAISKLYFAFSKQSLYIKLSIILIFILLLAFSLCSLAPPTDADSLDYHLGVPATYLIYGYKFPFYAWLHSRLVGLGEVWNLIGLATWTDSLNSVLQFSGLIALLVVFWKYMQKKSEQIDYKLFAAKLLLGVPVLLFLLPNQKPQLIGTIAIIASLMLCIIKEKQTKLTCFLSLGALFFAFGLKYSFYVTGFVPFFFIAYTAYKNKLFKCFVFYSILFYALFLFPIHLFNTISYGNPVTPLFPALFNERGYATLTSFTHMLKTYKEGFGFPLGLLIPSKIGEISTVLGVGVFTFFFIDFKNRKVVEIFIVAILTFILGAIAGQGTSRFFLDSYYMILLAFVISPVRKKWFGGFDKLLTLQVVGVTMCAVMGAYFLFPGCLSSKGRNKVMQNSANEYSAMQYLDNTLPQKAFIISSFRSNALIPREFIASDYLFMMKYYPEEFTKRLEQLHGKECFYITKNKITPTNPLYVFLSSQNPYFKPKKFMKATRNPFNKTPYSLYVYKLNPQKLENSL